MGESGEERLIHLLYVPTLACNLGCRYCYLGSQTDNKQLARDGERALDTLRRGVDKFRSAGVVPFNISLHGGEVTTLPSGVLEELLQYISSYYKDNKKLLLRHGFRKDRPHIKTNLYDLARHYELLVKYGVSISGSIDLPLSLHEKYRTTKSGASSLGRCLENIHLLAAYPHRAKMSAVVYGEHLEQADDIIRDIKMLHYEYGMNMNTFNFMFGFSSRFNKEKFGDGGENGALETAGGEQQVAFYQALKREFMGTDLEEGFTTHWFDEFTPTYCTNCFNCGEKFFLLQGSGDVYSCVRGQGVEEFHYGNILSERTEDVLTRARGKILAAHRSAGLAADCEQCGYLSICHTGCPYVKLELGIAKSYTCALQKKMYADAPELYPRSDGVECRLRFNEYVSDMHPHLVATRIRPVVRSELILPGDLNEEKNSLRAIIGSDEKLQVLYSNEIFYLERNGKIFNLESQILKPARTLFTFGAAGSVTLHVRKSIFSVNCGEPIRNRLLIMFLRDTEVVYGDERRRKQEHTHNFEIFYNMLEESSVMGSEFYGYDLSMLLALLEGSYRENVLNNVFVTTSHLRDYHYEKQKNNGFYHIQALNLPFQNIEFYYKNK